VSYFVEGRTWWLHRLVAERDEACLLVSPGGLSLAWLATAEPDVEPGPPQLEHAGQSCRLEEAMTAAARVQTRSGPESEGTVSLWRYSCADGRLLWIERWGAETRAYLGVSIRPPELEIWPAQAAPGP